MLQNARKAAALQTCREAVHEIVREMPHAAYGAVAWEDTAAHAAVRRRWAAVSGDLKRADLRQLSRVDLLTALQCAGTSKVDPGLAKALAPEVFKRAHLLTSCQAAAALASFVRLRVTPMTLFDRLVQVVVAAAHAGKPAGSRLPGLTPETAASALWALRTLLWTYDSFAAVPVLAVVAARDSVRSAAPLEGDLRHFAAITSCLAVASSPGGLQPAAADAYFSPLARRVAGAPREMRRVAAGVLLQLVRAVLTFPSGGGAGSNALVAACLRSRPSVFSALAAPDQAAALRRLAAAGGVPPAVSRGVLQRGDPPSVLALLRSLPDAEGSRALAAGVRLVSFTREPWLFAAEFVRHCAAKFPDPAAEGSAGVWEHLCDALREAALRRSPEPSVTDGITACLPRPVWATGGGWLATAALWRATPWAGDGPRALKAAKLADRHALVCPRAWGPWATALLRRDWFLPLDFKATTEVVCAVLRALGGGSGGRQTAHVFRGKVEVGESLGGMPAVSFNTGQLLKLCAAFASAGVDPPGVVATTLASRMRKFASGTIPASRRAMHSVPPSDLAILVTEVCTTELSPNGRPPLRGARTYRPLFSETASAGSARTTTHPALLENRLREVHRPGFCTNNRPPIRSLGNCVPPEKEPAEENDFPRLPTQRNLTVVRSASWNSLDGKELAGEKDVPRRPAQRNLTVVRSASWNSLDGKELAGEKDVPRRPAQRNLAVVRNASWNSLDASQEPAEEVPEHSRSSTAPYSAPVTAEILPCAARLLREAAAAAEASAGGDPLRFLTRAVPRDLASIVASAVHWGRRAPGAAPLFDAFRAACLSFFSKTAAAGCVGPGSRGEGRATSCASEPPRWVWDVVHAGLAVRDHVDGVLEGGGLRVVGASLRGVVVEAGTSGGQLGCNQAPDSGGDLGSPNGCWAHPVPAQAGMPPEQELWKLAVPAPAGEGKGRRHPVLAQAGMPPEQELWKLAVQAGEGKRMRHPEPAQAGMTPEEELWKLAVPAPAGEGKGKRSRLFLQAFHELRLVATPVRPDAGEEGGARRYLLAGPAPGPVALFVRLFLRCRRQAAAAALCAHPAVDGALRGTPVACLRDALTVSLLPGAGEHAHWVDLASGFPGSVTMSFPPLPRGFCPSAAAAVLVSLSTSAPVLAVMLDVLFESDVLDSIPDPLFSALVAA
ncbi:hypothetical protein DIPPA_29140 [Diplonema papillatum]|nr:hypothetical protein DIPPA_29140 [Diplonema papillatum]